jgi:ABC-type multidrug transport system ATPase subunit
MAMLEPTLGILDETDSGLDIDALRIVANGVNKLRTPERSFIVVTHYQRLLDYIVPDYVHVLYNGRIVKTGTKELALELEEKGYDWIKSDAQNAASAVCPEVKRNLFRSRGAQLFVKMHWKNSAEWEFLQSDTKITST